MNEKIEKNILYVFLDVDGVLNNTSAFKLNKKTIFVLSHENMVAYQYLIDKLRERYEIMVILSSTWRTCQTGMNKLAKYSKKYNGLKLYDKTPNSHIRRCEEIENYCNNRNISLEDILIIDDDSMPKKFANRHIHTNENDGLKFSTVIQYIENIQDYRKDKKDINNMHEEAKIIVRKEIINSIEELNEQKTSLEIDMDNIDEQIEELERQLEELQ